MRPFITLVVVGSIVVALLALVGTVTHPREDDLSRSISTWVKTSR